MADKKYGRNCISLEMTDNELGTVDIVLTTSDPNLSLDLLDGAEKAWTPAQRLAAQLYAQLCIHNLQPPDPEGTA